MPHHLKIVKSKGSLNFHSKQTEEYEREKQKGLPKTPYVLLRHMIVGALTQKRLIERLLIFPEKNGKDRVLYNENITFVQRAKTKVNSNRYENEEKIQCQVNGVKTK